MNLSNEQRKAINHINGPALVLAVPGAGKTTVLINRTNNLIENEYPEDVLEQAEITIKYEGYINKAQRKVDKVKRMENKKIPQDIDYTKIDSLSNESVERLTLIQPETIAQASRISGVTPADIAILSVYVEQGAYETV